MSAARGPIPARHPFRQALNVLHSIPSHAWLVREALGGRSVQSLFEGFCEQLGSSPLALARGHLSVRILHPALSVYGMTWRRQTPGVADQVFGHADARSDAWQ